MNYLFMDRPPRLSLQMNYTEVMHFTHQRILEQGNSAIFSKHELHALHHSINTDPILKNLLLQYRPFGKAFSNIFKRSLEILRIHHPGLNVHDPLLEEKREQAMTWLQENYAARNQRENIDHLQALLEQQIHKVETTSSPESIYLKTLLQQQERSRYQERLEDPSSPKTPAAPIEAICKDFHNYIQHVFLPTESEGYSELAQLYEWYLRENETFVPTDIQLIPLSLEILILSLDDARTGYHATHDKYFRDTDYSCPLGLKERTLDRAYPVARHHLGNLPLTPSEQLATMLTQGFITLNAMQQYVPSELVYKAYAVSHGYTAQPMTIYRWSRKEHIPYDLYDVVLNRYVSSNIREIQSDLEKYSALLNKEDKTPIEKMTTIELRRKTLPYRRSGDSPESLSSVELQELLSKNFEKHLIQICTYVQEEEFPDPHRIGYHFLLEKESILSIDLVVETTLLKEEAQARFCAALALEPSHYELLMSVIGQSKILPPRSVPGEVLLDSWIQSGKIYSQNQLTSDWNRDAFLALVQAHLGTKELPMIQYCVERSELIDDLIMNAILHPNFSFIPCSDKHLSYLLHRHNSRMSSELCCKIALFCARIGYVESLSTLLSFPQDSHAYTSPDTTEPNASHSLLSWASWHNHVEIIELLCTHSVQINPSEPERHSALLYAAANDSLKAIDLLLAHGADPYRVNMGGETALMTACSRASLATIERLFSAAPEIINLRNTYQNTAIMYAATQGNMDAIRFLVAHKADLSLQNQEDNTALILATLAGHVEAALYLAEHGAAYINLQNKGFQSALLIAASQGNYVMTRAFYLQGAEVFATDISNNTALLLAIFSGNMQLITYLIEQAPALLNIANNMLTTPLIAAVTTGNLTLVKMACEYHANIADCDANGDSALLFAVSSGREDITKFLLEQHPEGVFLENLSHQSALCLASAGGHLQSVRLLHQYSASLNHLSDGGFTPIMLATSYGHLAVVEYLFHAGANPYYANEQGLTILEVAAQSGQSSIVEFLCRNCPNLINFLSPSGSSPLILSCAAGKQLCARILCDFGADYNKTDRDGNTALIVAAAGGHEGIVDALCALGANPLPTNSEKYSALMAATAANHERTAQALCRYQQEQKILSVDDLSRALLIACYYGHYDITYSLCLAGAFINVQDTDGNTPLILATMLGDIRTVIMLHFFEPDLDIRNNEGTSALTIATISNLHSMVEVLCEYGADTETQDLQMRTPLIHACCHGYFHIVQKLCSYAADVNATDCNLDTPLMHAVEKGVFEIVDLLCERGAAIDSVNNNGDTAISLALEYGHLAIANHLEIQLLIEQNSEIPESALEPFEADIPDIEATPTLSMTMLNIPSASESPSPSSTAPTEAEPIVFSNSPVETSSKPGLNKNKSRT